MILDMNLFDFLSLLLRYEEWNRQTLVSRLGNNSEHE